MILLRSALFNAWFFGVSTLLALGSLPLRLLPLGPTPPWAPRLAALWAQIVLGGLRAICGTRWRIVGLENIPHGAPALIASMHQSAFDTMVWLPILSRPCYVLKTELSRIPIFGAICRLCGMITVDRSGGTAAMRHLLKECDRAVREARQIVIFPEGTRVTPGRIVKLQPGIAAMAAHAGLPVIPVLTDSGLRWGRAAFRKNPGTIRVLVRPALPAGLPRQELMARLAAEFAAAETRLAAIDGPGAPVQACA